MSITRPPLRKSRQRGGVDIKWNGPYFKAAKGYPLMSSMALSKIAFSFIIIFAAFNLATLSPNVNNVFAQLCNILLSWMPSVADSASVEEILLRIHKYCTERLFERVCALIQPAFKNLFNVVTDGLLLLHNNGMSYTDEILQQALGIDG